MPSVCLGSDPPGRVGTIARLAEYGIRPDTSLGQHFLVDENLADLAIRQARLDPMSVVLEIGAGVGTLTEALAHAAGHVHAVEIDSRLQPALEDVSASFPNVSLHMGDAMRLDLAALAPAPTHFVANLPYHVATPLLVDSLWELPHVVRWVVMVQREVADRWLAGPGSKLYGAPSVLMQHSSTSDFRRQVGRDVFAPRPRVDSALVGLTRTGPGPSPALRSLVHAAFATRRKTLTNALAGAGADPAAVRAALAEIGLPADVRAEALPVEAFERLVEVLAWTA